MTRADGAGRAALVFATLGLVCAQALAAGLVPAARAQGGPGALAAPCPALGGTFNRWTPLKTPARLALPHVASFAQDPCTFIGATASGGVYRSTDASTWSPAVDLDGLDVVAGVVTEEMPAGTAFVYGTPDPGLLGGDGSALGASGLYVTRDFGATFQAIPDLAGYSVTAVAAAPSDPQVMYAAASPLVRAAPLALKSDDFGRTWLPLPGSLPVRPTRLVVDARLPQVVWANSSVDGATPSSGVWHSTNGGVVFSRVRDDTVVDFDAAPVPGGGSRVDMATAAGLVRTRDDGTTFRTVTSDPVAAVTHETFAPDALMAVVDARAVRSTTSGRTFKATPGVGGLAGCTVTNLTRNEEFPSHFLLSLADCAAEGHYLYRSDGRDLLNLEDIGGDVDRGLLPRVERLPRSDMRILREIHLPENGDTSSGSLAFDGEMLYYTNNDTSNEIYVSTTTGDHVRTLTLEPGTDVRTLTYDPHLEVMWALVNEGGRSFDAMGFMYQVDPVTGAATRMFRSPLEAQTTLSMDPTAGVFRSYLHHGYEVYEISREGAIVDECTVPGSPVDPNLSTNPDRGHQESTAPGFASGLAVGGGRMYLQLEDDRTIYHVSKECEILAVFEHRRFAESRGGPSGLENDQMACDTVTFGEPAIWIRDALPNTAVAYAVPNGYCPLDSKLVLTPPKLTARSGETARACALLVGDGPNGTAMPVGGAEVTFFADDLPVAAAVTDGDGFACASFPAPRGEPATIPIEASFFGTISFRASSGTGILETYVPVFREPKVPVPPPPPPAPPQVVALALPPPPPLPQVPASGTAQAPQPQQQPQSQAQQQPQAQAQAGLVTQKQQQTQLAFAFSAEESTQLSEEYAMSERRERNTRLTLQGGAALVVLAFGWCMTRGSLAFRKVRR